MVALTRAQKDFLLHELTPALEPILLALHNSSDFIWKYDAFQARTGKLPETTDILDDARTNQRPDVPQLSGREMLNLRNFIVSMRGRS